MPSIYQVRLPSPVALEGVRDQIRRYQRENNLGSEGEALEAILFALTPLYRPQRKLAKAERKLKYLLLSVRIGGVWTKRQVEVIRELANGEIKKGEKRTKGREGREGDEVASDENPKESPISGGGDPREGRDEVVQAFEGREGSEGRGEVASL
jgi:hypothetical protein